MKRLKKGFSLAEGVIALAVIVIISGAVTTLCIYCARTTPKLYAKFQASNIAADVVTCFNKSSGESEFISYLYFYVNGNSGDSTNVTHEVNTTAYCFIIDNVMAEVEAYFNYNTLDIKTYLSTSDSLLYTYSYTGGT